jgi:hypothetical protein
MPKIRWKRDSHRREALHGASARSTDPKQPRSRTLAAIRITLLPTLLSGEIRVKDAERLVEAVV